MCFMGGPLNQHLKLLWILQSWEMFWFSGTTYPVGHTSTITSRTAEPTQLNSTGTRLQLWLQSLTGSDRWDFPADLTVCSKWFQESDQLVFHIFKPLHLQISSCSCSASAFCSYTCNHSPTDFPVPSAATLTVLKQQIVAGIRPMVRSIAANSLPAKKHWMMHFIFDEKGKKCCIWYLLKRGKNAAFDIWWKRGGEKPFASDCIDLVFSPINSLRSEIEQDINPITELHLDLVCFLSASQITFDWQSLSTGQLLRRQSRGNQFLAQICNPGNPWWWALTSY